jgi:hypothetical protein
MTKEVVAAVPQYRHRTSQTMKRQQPEPSNCVMPMGAIATAPTLVPVRAKQRHRETGCFIRALEIKQWRYFGQQASRSTNVDTRASSQTVVGKDGL